MTGRPLGYVKEPITCPGDGRGPACSVITAVPISGRMWLTEDAAGWAPHGYRCKAHRRPTPLRGLPQPPDAPPRLPRKATRSWSDPKVAELVDRLLERTG